jgi:hypothetical protein
MEPGSDDRDRIHPNASSPSKTGADVAPLIQKVGAPSIAQIEKLIGELHEARNLLESGSGRLYAPPIRTVAAPTHRGSGRALTPLVFHQLELWDDAKVVLPDEVLELRASSQGVEGRILPPSGKR